MIVGVPKEIKPDENRVGIVPAGVETLSQRGHKVLVEAGAGLGSGIADQEFRNAGAEICAGPDELHSRAELVLKVKEPLPVEFPALRGEQIVFAFFHFAADRELTESAIERGIVAIAYETIQTPQGKLPLLIPMSEVAGKMAVQEGAKYLEKPMMGRGILLGGVPGVLPANVLIIGGGTVGTYAAKVAAGLGADVTLLDINLDRLRYLADVMPPNVKLLTYSAHNVRSLLPHADLVVGAVLIQGAKTPTVITRGMLKLMKSGTVIVDVSIDQGGCVETSRPTTHKDPTYVVDGVVHYCVTNMPGAVARTSTLALTNATLPFATEIADKGYKRAAKENHAIAKGINIMHGKVTHKGVADTFGLPYVPVKQLL